MTILVKDGLQKIGDWNAFGREIAASTLYAVRHPKKRHLYEVIKSRYTNKPDRLITLNTLNKHINLTLKSIK